MKKKGTPQGGKTLLHTYKKSTTPKRRHACAHRGIKRYRYLSVFSLRVDYDDRDSTAQVIRIHQGGLSMPDKVIIWKKARVLKKYEKKYILYIEKIFALMGDEKKKLREKSADDFKYGNKIRAPNDLPRKNARP